MEQLQTGIYRIYGKKAMFLKFGEFTIEKRQKVSVFYECRSICDRFPVKETWRVLCKSNSR